MKQHRPEQSVESLCRLFGKTRHSYYDYQWRAEKATLKEEVVLQLVHEVRLRLPRAGTRRLLVLLAPGLASHQIKVGRDYLFDLLEANKLLVRSRRRKAYTTNSQHWMHKYTNIAQNLVIDRPEQLWVSDMTYIRVMNQWGYLSLITDAYSRKIMGHCFRNDMLTEGCLEALKMALAGRIYPNRRLVHHSDRGCQYCCKDYVNLLKEHEVDISMTERGDPYENALAERINGILKMEFGLYGSQSGFDETYKLIKRSIRDYNEYRPHSSCNNMTPERAHHSTGLLKKLWKNYRQPTTGAEWAAAAPPKERAKPIQYGEYREEEA